MRDRNGDKMTSTEELNASSILQCKDEDINEMPEMN